MSGRLVRSKFTDQPLDDARMEVRSSATHLTSAGQVARTGGARVGAVAQLLRLSAAGAAMRCACVGTCEYYERCSCAAAVSVMCFYGPGVQLQACLHDHSVSRHCWWALPGIGCACMTQRRRTRSVSPAMRNNLGLAGGAGVPNTGVPNLPAYFPAAALSTAAIGRSGAGAHLHRLLAEAQNFQDARRRRPDQASVRSTNLFTLTQYVVCSLACDGFGLASPLRSEVGVSSDALNVVRAWELL